MLDLIPVDRTEDFSYSGKTLMERVTGKFYTPDFLATELAAQMLAAGSARARAPLRAIDPFCGDGQLVAALLCRAAEDPQLLRLPWEISLWDRDPLALDQATHRIGELTAKLGFKAALRVQLIDSYAAELLPQYDFVITNPPWELLKPDSRETAQMSLREAQEYRERLRAASDGLDARFPDARAANAWGGWATNLARCGWDLSMRLLSPRGILGIVLPSTLFADQASERIRRVAFETCRAVDIAAFPPEAKLFNRVDQAVVAATFSADVAEARMGRLRIFDANRLERNVLPLPSSLALSARGYGIPVGFGATSQGLFDKISHLPRLADWEGEAPTDLWLGRELDETRISEKTVAGIGHPFIKGRMISRHSVVEPPTRSVRADLASKFRSAQFPRAVWRDVSRASQKRRMIGAVIPPGWVAGNSLHVAHFRDGNPARTLALHGILSSLVLEFQVRSRLGTGHMSLGVVRQAHVPHLTNKSADALAGAARRAAKGSKSASLRLEVAVAKAYGVDRDALASIIDSFEKIDDEERRALLERQMWVG